MIWNGIRRKTDRGQSYRAKPACSHGTIEGPGRPARGCRSAAPRAALGRPRRNRRRTGVSKPRRQNRLLDYGPYFQRVQYTADLICPPTSPNQRVQQRTYRAGLHRPPAGGRNQPYRTAYLPRCWATEERQVTTDGARYALPDNFTVRHAEPGRPEGTYPLTV